MQPISWEESVKVLKRLSKEKTVLFIHVTESMIRFVIFTTEYMSIVGRYA